MRIVTFNVQHARTPTGAVDTAAMARYCAGLGADVLALQEVDVGLRRSRRANQAAAVARSTGLDVAFGAARWVGLWGRYGNALLARGVHDVKVVRLPRQGWRRERRAALLASVDAAGGRVSVAATHLSTDSSEAAVQLDALAAALRARPGPWLLVGDLNLRPDRAVPALARHGLSLADPSAPTYPAHRPFLRIDHVAADGLALGAVQVLDAAPVSDHRPLLVEAASRPA